MIIAERNNFAIAQIERQGLLIYIIVRTIADTPDYAAYQSLASFGWPREGEVPSDAWARQQAFGALESLS